MKRFLFIMLCTLCCFASHALPNGYTQLEYLESTGTQYIDTGVNVEFLKNFKVVGQAIHSNASCRNILLGNWGIGGPSYNIEFGCSGAFRHYLRNNGIDDFSSNFVLPENTLITYDSDYNATNHTVSSTLTYNDTLQSYTVNVQPHSGTTAYTLRLFLDYRSSTETANPVSIGKTKLYADNILVRDFIPAKRNSDNVIGMYDTVSNTFFTNAGSGTFIAGPEITGIAAVSYVDGMYEAIDNKKMAKLTANSIEYTDDSSPAGVVTSVVGAGDKLRVTRKPVTIPVIDTSNNSVQAQAQIWVD